MKPLGYNFEHRILKQGYSLVVGCDEVGRGALAGPIVAAAVAFGHEAYNMKHEAWKEKIKDSKLLKASVREELAIHIKQNCLAWSVARVSPSVIDEINIHQANLLALHRAVSALHKKLAASNDGDSTYVLADGRFTIPAWNGSQEAVVDGDAKIFSIAAASIIAKVYRDEFMMKQDEKFPGYEFGRHKGYGTKLHQQRIEQKGLSRIHRQTFCAKLVEAI